MLRQRKLKTTLQQSHTNDSHTGVKYGNSTVSNKHNANSTCLIMSQLLEFNPPWWLSAEDMKHVRYICPSLFGSMTLFKNILNYCKTNPNIKPLSKVIKNNTSFRLPLLIRPNLEAFGYYLYTNTTLKELYLENYNIGHLGGKSIADGLKNNSTLEKLKLLGANVGDIG